MKRILIAIAAIALSLGTVACNKKNEGSKVSRVQRGYGSGSGLVTQDGQMAGWDALMNSPTATLTGQSVATSAKNLLELTVSSDQIGEISDVVVAMNIYRSSNGQINSEKTRLGIVVWDSYALSQQADPLTILMDSYWGANVSGEISGTNIYVTFEDQYGQIIVSGSIRGNTVSGQIRYTGASGGVNSLGNFSLPFTGTIF